MRAALVLVLVLLPAAAQAAIRPVQAEVIVSDSRDPAQAKFILDLKDGRRTAVSILCSGEGREVRCQLVKPNSWFAMAGLDIDQALMAGGTRSKTCQVNGVLVTLSVSDLVQTRAEPYADSYHFRVEAGPAGRQVAEPCPRGERWPPARY